jgi:hypothetical protein
MECTHCNNTFKNKSALNIHEKTAKYCLKLRKISMIEYKCESCKKIFSTLTNLNRHQKSCKIGDIISSKIDIIDKYKQKLIYSEEKMVFFEEKMMFLQNELAKKDLVIKELHNKLENVAVKAIQRDFTYETTIDIDDTCSENKSEVVLSDSESDSDNETEEYKLTPLEVGQGFTIEHREEDGYINVTNLCKAGGKLFKNWKKTQKTKAFLQVLSTEVPNGTSDLIKLGKSTFGKDGQQQVLSSLVPIGTNELIKYKSGSNDERSTWVHPQVAINIAQWISPQFDVKVSGWVYEIMMTGKVDITNTTSFKDLQSENKNQKIKIQYLTKKYVKAQPRVQYKEPCVVYILTTKSMKKDRRYILGKATNLTNRLSTYNKSDEHEVVYYQGCEDENTMGIVETMVFSRLEKYREQANRERFILPEKEEIGLFSQVINKSIEFLK